MNSNIIKIGNSKGVRIPSNFLEKLSLDLNDNINIEISNGNIIISPSKARSGWDKAFKNMHINGDDKLIDIPALEEDQW
ncbi:MAG: AbrB/MazE/SpoVT family DNA-binding domain-containing protein [Clostridiales bacterium]